MALDYPGQSRVGGPMGDRGCHVNTETPADGLDPPGEQLALFPDPGFVETIVHKVQVHGYGGVQFYWTCVCGESGQPTAHGRAHGGASRHMTAVRRRARLRADRP